MGEVIRTPRFKGESGTLAPADRPAADSQQLDRALISEIAMDVGKELVAYLEVQYPDVFKAMNSGCKLSIRNHVHNDIMAAVETVNAEDIKLRLARRRKERRDWLRRWRRIRAMGEPATEADKLWLANELTRAGARWPE